MTLKQKIKNYQNIPAELKKYRQWVVADANKIPYNPISKMKASSTNPLQWASFEECVNALDDTLFLYIGFVLSLNDPYCIIDLDDKEELDNDSEKAQQFKAEREIVYNHPLAQNTYREISVSGRGVHIVGKAKIPYSSGVRKGLVEIYDSKRFMIFTGDKEPNSTTEINDINPLIEEIWLKYKGDKDTLQQTAFQLSAQEHQTCASVLGDVFNGTQKITFHKAYNGDYLSMPSCQSLSEAYYYVVRTLAKYTADTTIIRDIVMDSPIGKMELKKKGNRFHKMVLELAEQAVLEEAPYRNASLLESANSLENLAPIAPLAIQSEFKVVKNIEPQKINIMEACLKEMCSSGALKLIKDHILETSYNKNEDIASIASMAFMQAIIGRKYQVMSGGQPIGLNQYMLVAARTGYGKDALSSGIHNLKNRYATEKASNEINNYFGAGSFSSGVAFIKSFQVPQPKKTKADKSSVAEKYSDLFKAEGIEDNSKMCYLSVLNESASLFKTMASGKDIYKNGLLSSFLEFYTKSSKYATVQPHEKADKEENTTILYSPCFSLLAELTNTDLQSLYSSPLVENGFFPRFLVFDIKKKEAGKKNDPAGEEMPLNKKLVACIDKMLRVARKELNNPNRKNYFINIKWQPEALENFRKFEDKQDKLRNFFNDRGLKIISDMINRNNLKALKLIGLLAVNEVISDIENSNDFETPIITNDHVIKATQLVESISNNYIDDYNQGNLGASITASVMKMAYECDNMLENLLPFKDSVTLIDEETGDEVYATDKAKIDENTQLVLGAEAFKYNPYLLSRSFLENISINFNDDSFFKNNKGLIDYMLKMGLLRELNVKELGEYPALMEEYFNTHKRQAFYYRTNDWNKFKIKNQIDIEKLEKEV